MSMWKVLSSGGYDPVHPGHIEALQKAKALRGGGDNTWHIVALNSDDWLVRKKGYLMMTWEQRAAVLRELRCVDEVVPVNDKDGTVVEALRRLYPHVFAKGGDRLAENTPEAEFCKQADIEVAYGLGDKIASSSTIFMGSLPDVQRKWGSYRVIYTGGGRQIKILTVNPGCKTSNQRHFRRTEYFVNLDNLGRWTTFACVPSGTWHELTNDTTKPVEYLEIQVGDIDESDIERRDDQHTAPVTLAPRREHQLYGQPGENPGA